MTADIRFVIIANPRTGTNLLKDLLNSHAAVTCHGEVFHPDAVYFQEGPRNELLKKRNEDPLGFLYQLYEACATQACGFKIFKNQNDCVLEAVLRDRRLRKIVLYRRNILAVYSSDMIARAEKRYRIMEDMRDRLGSKLGDNARTTARATFDRSNFEAYVRVYESYYKYVVDLLNGTDQNYMLLTYEDYINESLFRRVFPFLGLSQPAMLHTGVKKMNSSDILSRFVNAGEVRDYLSEIGKPNWAYEDFTLWSYSGAVQLCDSGSFDVEKVVRQKNTPVATTDRFKKARLIAFYLPQFHPIPENDEWWGRGFTEWTNTAKAKPLFGGHYQPRIPADLGYYDLRVPETRWAQAEMARKYGIEGFCYWHYWFNGKRLLERPFNEVLKSGEPDFPFCLGWANDSWTGVWHGCADKLLIEQTYPGAEDERAHFYALLEAFFDKRYMRVEGRPLFLIYKPYMHPEPRRFIEHWKELGIKEGLGEIYFVGNARTLDWIPEKDGFDARTLHNPGLVLHRSFKYFDPPSGFLDKASLALTDKRFREWRRTTFNRPDIFLYRDYVTYGLPPLRKEFDEYPCVMPNWDNTPRCGIYGYLFHDSTPELFRRHLKGALEQVAHREPEKRLIFVKSWNEWAEGNHLEPDLKFGAAYLEACRDEIL